MPVRASSETDPKYDALKNCGALSLISVIEISTSVVSESGGLPPSLAVTVSKYPLCTSRSNGFVVTMAPL